MWQRRVVLEINVLLVYVVTLGANGLKENPYDYEHDFGESNYLQRLRGINRPSEILMGITQNIPRYNENAIKYKSPNLGNDYDTNRFNTQHNFKRNSPVLANNDYINYSQLDRAYNNKRNINLHPYKNVMDDRNLSRRTNKKLNKNYRKHGAGFNFDMNISDNPIIQNENNQSKLQNNEKKMQQTLKNVMRNEVLQNIDSKFSQKFEQNLNTIKKSLDSKPSNLTQGQNLTTKYTRIDPIAAQSFNRARDDQKIQANPIITIPTVAPTETTAIKVPAVTTMIAPLRTTIHSSTTEANKIIISPRVSTIAEIDQGLKTFGNFGAFLRGLFEKLAAMRPVDAQQLVKAFQIEFVEWLDNGFLTGMEPALRDDLKERISILDRIPPEILTDYCAYISHILTEEPMGDFKNVLDFADNLFNEFQRKQLLSSLTLIENFPSSNATANIILKNITEPLKEVFNNAPTIRHMIHGFISELIYLIQRKSTEPRKFRRNYYKEKKQLPEAFYRRKTNHNKRNRNNEVRQRKDKRVAKKSRQKYADGFNLYVDMEDQSLSDKIKLKAKARKTFKKQRLKESFESVPFKGAIDKTVGKITKKTFGYNTIKYSHEDENSLPNEYNLSDNEYTRSRISDVINSKKIIKLKDNKSKDVTSEFDDDLYDKHIRDQVLEPDIIRYKKVSNKDMTSDENYRKHFEEFVTIKSRRNYPIERRDRTKNNVDLIRRETSESSDESELRKQLADTIRHNDFYFKNHRNIFKIINEKPKIDLISSYSDEEAIMKRNIYKAIGVQPHTA